MRYSEEVLWWKLKNAQLGEMVIRQAEPKIEKPAPKTTQQLLHCAFATTLRPLHLIAGQNAPADSAFDMMKIERLNPLLEARLRRKLESWRASPEFAIGLPRIRARLFLTLKIRCNMRRIVWRILIVSISMFTTQRCLLSLQARPSKSETRCWRASAWLSR